MHIFHLYIDYRFHTGVMGVMGVMVVPKEAMEVVAMAKEVVGVKAVTEVELEVVRAAPMEVSRVL